MLFSFKEKSTTLRPQYLKFTKDHESEFYPPQNSIEEISITPIAGSAKKLSSHQQDIDFVNRMVVICNCYLIFCLTNKNV